MAKYWYYCLRCKALAVMEPGEANCDKCKKELGEELARRNSGRNN